MAPLASFLAGAIFLVVSATAQSAPVYLAMTHDASSGAAACDPSAVTSGYANNSYVPPPRHLVQLVFSARDVGPDYRGVLFLGLPSTTAVPVPGFCGDVLMDPAALIVHPRSVSPSFWYVWNFEIPRDIARGLMLWAQVLVWDSSTGDIRSLGDRFIIETR